MKKTLFFLFLFPSLVSGEVAVTAYNVSVLLRHVFREAPVW